jgi:HEAT repeat protein
VPARERAGTLSNGEAASRARAVAEREVRAAAGAEALERVRDAGPCARELDAAFAARMRVHDEAGAEAALARIAGRELGLDDARRYLADPDPHWRAVGARALVRLEDHEARLRALVDPEPHVRRAAAHAASEAHDPADLAALADAARLDPESIVRTDAVRALAALPATPDGGVANVLRDLWSSADDGLREDIALAWSTPEIWRAGGLEALRVVVASEEGSGAIEAAAAVLRRRDAGGDVAEAAVAQFARAFQRGSSRTRLQALAQAPLERHELQPIVRALSESDDLDIRVAALARLASTRNDRTARAALESLAQPGSRVAERARLALASAGDRSVQAWIEQDLVAPEAGDRLAAAAALADLGVLARAAPLLADADARVRVRAACTMILAARRGR